MASKSGQSNSARVVFAGAVGNAIEFYDFTIYAFLAGYFVIHFFPTNDPVVGLLASYGALAIGMVMRPLGGVLFGLIGDRLSTRVALQASVILIAAPTFVIGLLPTYDQIGMGAPVLLVSLRMIQGLSLGGEYSSSIIYIVENAPRRRGYWGSFSPMGAFGGFFLGTGICMLVAQALGAERMDDWGWRVPFLGSLVLAGIGVLVRLSLAVERRKPVAARSRSLLFSAFVGHWRLMVKIAMLNTASAITTFVGFAYATSWMVVASGVSRQHALAISLYGLSAAALFTLLGGFLGDRLGCLRISMVGLLTLVLGSWMAFLGMGGPETVLQIAGVSILAFGQGVFVGPMCAYMVMLVPSPVRTTVVSVGYSVAAGVFGGLAPLMTEYLHSRLDYEMAPAIVVIAGAAVSLVSAIVAGRWRFADPMPQGRLTGDATPTLERQAIN